MERPGAVQSRRNGRQHRRNGELEDGDDERTNRRRSTKTAIDGIGHPTRVRQTGHNEESWRTVMTLSGILKSGVGSGFPDRPPRWLGKGKWRRQTDGCKLGLGRDASGRAMCCPNAAGGIILEGSYTDRAALSVPWPVRFSSTALNPLPLSERKGRWQCALIRKRNYSIGRKGWI
jgi:hypothetical protein